MIYGLDTLLVGKYQNVALHNWPQGFAGGGFAIEAGDIYNFVDSLFTLNKAPAFRIQELWHPTHLYSDNDIPNITHLSQRYEQLALKHPDKKIYLSPFCEAQNIANPDRYLDIVALNAPHCIPVWAGINSHSTKYMNEIHGGGPAMTNYLRSGDGGIKVGASQHDDIDLDITHEKEKHSNSEIFFIWNCCFNGHYSMNDAPLPIDQRTGWPLPKDIQAAAYLATDRGNVQLDPHWLMKSDSELHGAPSTDPKGNKLMFIAPVHSDKIVLKRGGKVVDILPYFGTYKDGRFRYYSQRQGWEIGANVEVWIDGKRHGVVNCGFRTGN